MFSKCSLTSFYELEDQQQVLQNLMFLSQKPQVIAKLDRHIFQSEEQEKLKRQNSCRPKFRSTGQKTHRT